MSRDRFRLNSRVYEIALFAAALFVTGNPRVSGQTLKATLLGTITDSSDAVLPEVTVAITETDTNSRRSTVTSRAGFYVLTDLEPGTYRVEVQHPGFKKVVRAGIELTPNSTARVDLELSPGMVTEVIDVTASAPLLKTDRADIGGVFERQLIQNMPLLYNRNYQGLLGLLPGVVRSFRPHSEFYNSNDSLGTKVNGQGRQANNFQFEGLDNNFDEGNTTILVPPVEAIATVEVSTNNYNAEFGRGGGAVTNVTLRSGTNSLHGSMFHYHRNENLQARNTFAIIKAPTVYNQFGGALGGPVIKDRVFFFADYQGSRDRLGQFSSATIPSLPFRAGDLSTSTTVIYDPGTGGPDGTGRAPFAANRIPQNRISPIAQRILALIPAPTFDRPSANLLMNTSRTKDINSADGKMDYVIGSLDRLAFRYSFQNASLEDPGLYGIYGGPRAGGFAGRGSTRNRSVGINYTHIFSPTLVTEARVGFTRSRNDAVNADAGLMTSTEIGIRGANISPESGGITRIDIVGYTSPVIGTGSTMPWQLANTIIGFVSNTTKTLNNHIIKFGTDNRRTRNVDRSGHGNSYRGQFNFDVGQTALTGDPRTSVSNAFASFLLDRPNTFGRDLSPGTPSRREMLWTAYLQDKWQVMKRLTLDLGVRYEYWPSATPQFAGGFSYYNPFNNTLELAGIGNIPRNMGIVDQKKSFGPRLGLAFRINDKTVFRGGYGISHLPRGRLVPQYNYPIEQANSYTPPNAYTVIGAMATGFPAPTFVPIPSDGIIRNPPDNAYGTVPRDLPHSYVQSWNVALQRLLPGDFTLEVAYVANHGVNILSGININAGLIPNAGVAGQPLNLLFGRRAATNSRIGTHNYYDSLQARFDRRFANGFSLTTSYTWSKAINFSEDIGGVTITFLPLNRGRAQYDFTHLFNQSYIYELPFGSRGRWLRSGIGRWLLGDWQVNGILSAQTGFPLDLRVSAAALNMPGQINRPDLNGKPEILGNVGPGQKFFDVTRFSNPAPARFGTAGRNILSGPGLINVDLSVFRQFRLSERMTLEFRTESFNFTNTPHFSIPNTNFSSSGFGEVTDALQDQRQFQFGLRLVF